MKKSLSLFLALTMTMVLSVSAPSVVCAGKATPKAAIEQGEIKAEKIYIKSTDLPAFVVGNMKAADEAARAKYKHDDQGRPVFHELNAKTHLWMNSENIKGVDGFKSDYEIAQEALALQKKKLKKTYQDKIEEAARKRDEALAELERKRNGEFTDEEVSEYCRQKRAQEQAEGTDMEGMPAQPTAKCLNEDGRREMQEQAEADYEDKKREIEEQYKNEVADSQSKVNEIDAAEDAKALGEVKANQDQDVAKKREAAAAAETAVKNAKDKLNATCPGGSDGKTACADAQKELDKASSEAKTANAAAEAAKKKIVDQTVAENELNETVLYTQDRYGKDVANQKMDTIIEKQAQEATDKAVADYMKSAEANKLITQRCNPPGKGDLCKGNEDRLKDVRASVEEDFRTGTDEKPGYYQTYKKGLEDTAKEIVASSTSTADVTGVSFNKPKDNKRPVPTGEGVSDLASGNQS